MSETTIKDHVYTEEEIKQLSEAIGTVPTMMPDDNDPNLLIPPTGGELDYTVLESVNPDGSIKSEVIDLSAEGIETPMMDASILTSSAFTNMTDADMLQTIQLIQVIAPQKIKQMAPSQLLRMADELLPPTVKEQISVTANGNVMLMNQMKVMMVKELSALGAHDQFDDIMAELQHGLSAISNDTNRSLGEMRLDSMQQTIAHLEKIKKVAIEKEDVKAVDKINRTVAAINGAMDMSYLLAYIEELKETGRYRHVIKRGLRMEEKNIRKVFNRLESDTAFTFHRPELLEPALIRIYGEDNTANIRKLVIVLWELIMDKTVLDSPDAYFISMFLSNVYNHDTAYFMPSVQGFDTGIAQIFAIL